MKKTRLLCVIICMIVFLLTGCSRNTTPISKSGLYFDTIITITLYSDAHSKLLDECFLLAEKYEKLFSKTIETSDIYKINHSKGKPTVVDSETIYLLEMALSYAEMTDGLIDPTILPLSDLWNFGENETVPSSADINSALSNVDYETVIIDKKASTVTLNNPNAGVDLGFIAKGYIADKMKEYLLSNGVENALINLGGNILCVGSKPDKSAFVLGIQEPFSQGTSFIPNVSVKDKSLVTSGVYERCFYENDILYHHILDTQTGYPIDNGLWSVTILSDSSMEGDAYSTLCLCLGLDEALKLIEATEGMEAMIITEDLELYYSSGFPRK
ncbi:MAG: FAD:protein FMN transferase [Lachnospiraceae bacterium]|nr:FAD:protein FMN transferase [Lachnospiraceae bacterium]